MLKRQRPVSPPPSIITPLVESSVYNMMSKRRRTMPPPLDGQSRGWAEELDYDEHWSDGDSISQEDGAANPSEPLDNIGEYKVANTMLHELHTLQQHRLLFSPPPTPPSSSLSRSSLQNSCSPSVVSNAHSKIIDTGKHQRPDIPTKNLVHTTINTQRPTEEVFHVKERYEDTNRLLGSLFLSRRRQLNIPGGSDFT